ncbi:hypothetical protein [Nonomuraea sp. NPDC049695]|uniref:hypothetical protein n=1 Tax=Nonomuraea sp. NPDC049695 TaxID=3154734 RepID=UPI00343E8547
MAAGTRSVADLKQQLNLSAPNIRKALRDLRSRGFVEQLGARTANNLPETLGVEGC